MKKVLNAIIFLVLLACAGFIAWKAKLIPNPFEPSGPTPSPTPHRVQRDQLRVAVAQRPEKLLTTSLKRLLEVENLQLELVEYDPDTVWLELGSQELDLVIAPIGEAVQAQGRFENGRFLFFTGQSQGLDQLLAKPKAETPKRVGVYRQAATEFLARQMLPEASVVAASSQLEVEEWLRGGAVEAALIDTSITPPEFGEKYRLLTATSPEKPMPTVAVLSKDFADHAGEPHYQKRKQVLEAALKSWAGLVSYLDSQPEILKTTLKKEADQSGIDVDRLLAGYRYLSPSQGRSGLEEYHRSGFLKRTLDLLVLSGASNLSAPDWTAAVELPSPLEGAFENRAQSAPVNRPLPTPSASPESPSPSPTPSSTPESQESATPEASPTPEETASLSHLDLPPSYTYQEESLPVEWPEPSLKFKSSKSLNYPPVLSRKSAGIVAESTLYLREFSGKKHSISLDSELTTPVLVGDRALFLAAEGSVRALNFQGKELWSTSVTGTPMAGPSPLDDKLYYATAAGERGQVLCLDAIDGEKLWSATLNSPAACRPIPAQGNSDLLLVSTEAGELQALSLINGKLLWSQKLSTPVYIEPGAGSGKLANVEPDGTVRLRSLKDGQQLWETNLGTSLVASPTITSAGILVPSKDTYLYLLDQANGRILWKTRLSHPLSEPAIVFGDQIVQSDEGGRVNLLSLSSGALLKTIEVGSGWVSRVVMKAGRWAVVDSSGMCKVFSE